MDKKDFDVIIDSKLARYQRQIIIDGFGVEGQEKLKRAKAFIAGAGGLGGVIALYLAAAGVGRIGLADCDCVDLSNLNRQILYDINDIGNRKAEVAKKRIQKFNPDIEVEAITSEITEANADSLIKGYDFIVDAMDNFPTRYVLNSVAVKRKIPFFHGAIRGFEGRVSTMIPGKTACFRCIYPRFPPPEVIPVVGATPAVIGSLQATEVIKYITGLGSLLINKLLVYDGLSMDFMIIELRKRADCPECCNITEDHS